MHFTSLLCLILALFAPITIKAVNHPTKTSGGSLGSEHQYELVDCTEIKECTPCSFSQMKTIKECSINGDIRTEQCYRVNTNDPTERIGQHFYKACQVQGIANYTIYIFIVSLLILLQVFFVLLTKYRRTLEMNMYKRLSINKTPL